MARTASIRREKSARSRLLDPAEPFQFGVQAATKINRDCDRHRLANIFTRRQTTPNAAMKDEVLTRHRELTPGFTDWRRRLVAGYDLVDTEKILRIILPGRLS